MIIIIIGWHDEMMDVDLQAKVVVFPPGHRFGVEIVEQIDEIERHPRSSKDGHHGDQHAVRSTLSLAIQLLAAAAP